MSSSQTTSQIPIQRKTLLADWPRSRFRCLLDACTPAVEIKTGLRKVHTSAQCRKTEKFCRKLHWSFGRSRVIFILLAFSNSILGREKRTCCSFAELPRSWARLSWDWYSQTFPAAQS